MDMKLPFAVDKRYTGAVITAIFKALESLYQDVIGSV